MSMSSLTIPLTSSTTVATVIPVRRATLWYHPITFNGSEYEHTYGVCQYGLSEPLESFDLGIEAALMKMWRNGKDLVAYADIVFNGKIITKWSDCSFDPDSNTISTLYLVIRSCNGFNSDVVSPYFKSCASSTKLITEQLTCSICTGLFKNAVITNNADTKNRVDACAHSFCEKCATDWIKQKPTCPLCRQPCTLDQLANDSVSRRKLVDLPISCRSCYKDYTFGKEGCNVYAHLTFLCPNMLVLCKYAHCNTSYPTLTRRDYTNHITSICRFRPVKCSDCNVLPLPFNQLEEHKRYNCPFNSQTVPGSTTQNALTTCAYGCPEQRPMTCYGLKRHVQESQFEHIEIVFKELRKASSRIDELQVEVLALKIQNALLQVTEIQTNLVESVQTKVATDESDNQVNNLTRKRQKRKVAKY